MSRTTTLMRPPAGQPRADEPPQPRAASFKDKRFESDDRKREMTEFLQARERLTDQEAVDTIEDMRPAALVYLELQLKSATAERGYSSEYDPFAGVY